MFETLAVLAIVVIFVAVVIKLAKNDAKKLFAANTGPQAGKPKPPRPQANTVDFKLPDIGEPGTATERQMTSVSRLIDGPAPKKLSSAQASLLLTARDYGEAVIASFRSDGIHLGHDALVLLVTFMVSDKEFLNYLEEWDRKRFRRGTHNSPPRLRRNNPHYQRARQFIESLL